MCGIHLIVDKRNTVSPAAIEAMTASTVHRGPDFSAVHQTSVQGQTFYFGHNRLCILDKSQAAHQPFFSNDKRYLLTYNGEIYNYRELRQELQTTYHFRTESDTEVVLALLIRDGAAGLHKLNGMFAVCFFDSLTGKLLLARDRFGIKPLYFAESENYLLAASELHSILKSGLVKKKLNAGQIGHYLRYKSAKAPDTFYEGIKELLPGQILTTEPGKLPQIDYFHTSASEPSLLTFSEAELLTRTETALLTAVEQQLVADVPVGIFLSGGVDSTLLLAMMAELGHTKFPAFTISHASAEGSFGTRDAHFGPMAARQYGAELSNFEISKEILQLLPEVIAGLEQPIADSGALLTYFISQQAAKTVTVALSGAGADEVFGGYNRHQAFHKYLSYRLFGTGLFPLLKLTAKLPTGTHTPFRKQFRLLSKLAPAIDKDPGKTFQNFTSMAPELARLYKHPHQEHEISVLQNQDWLRWALDTDLQQYLVSDILTMTDKMSMRSSLEIRVPYLDNEVVELTRLVPTDLLFRKGRKWVLRDLLRKRGGAAFADRSKEGFGLPLGNWLRNAENSWLLAPLRNSSHPLFDHLDFSQTQKFLGRHQNQQSDYASEIWALIVLAFWLEKEFS